jgi:hypothetical protein
LNLVKVLPLLLWLENGHFGPSCIFVLHSNYFSRPKWANPRSKVSPEKFRANFLRFGRNFPKSANFSAEQWTKLTQIGRISPEFFEGEPQLRGFAHFEQVSPKKKLLCTERQETAGSSVFYSESGQGG